MVSPPQRLKVNRRSLLVGGGVGVGLLLAWSLWPRRFPVTWRAAPGEDLFNAYLKVGLDGRVIVAVPQTELGQGVYTSLPQILADELGADWRTVSVEPAPINPLYGNRLFAGDSGWLGDSPIPMVTGGSTSIRAFEAPMREAGAAGRALLSKAAAQRWDVDWESLDTHEGFVWNGREKISFGELAEAAAGMEVPGDLPMRGGIDNRLAGQSVQRLDIPSKVDGSAQYAADIRVSDMLFASVRQGPSDDSRLVRSDRAAAEKIRGVVSVLENPQWVGALANTWWAANRAVEAMRPRFESPQSLPGSADLDTRFREALRAGKSISVFSRGDAADVLAQGHSFRANYSAMLAPTAALEPLTATVRPTGDRYEVWATTQVPELARLAAARAIGTSPNRVTLYRTIGGGGYGRKLETRAIEQAMALAAKVKRPVQLTWSRIEEMLHDSFRPPAHGEMIARLADDGTILAWQARIATATMRSIEGVPERSEAVGAAGGVPPYSIPAMTIEQLPTDVSVATSGWRSGSHSYTAFFTECFVDELARQAKFEPLSFRMQMLGDNTRLARVLSTAAMLGGWDGGGAGSAMGIAAHSAFGSYAALLVEVRLDKDQRVYVTRAVCAVDCGRIINPDVVRQQIEGGILFGIGAATGAPIRVERGLPTATSFGDLRLPILANAPDVTVELMPSDEDPGGVTELGVPPVAPAIGNALFALTGQRLRSLPFRPGTAG